ncbi:DUF421 domain-containing protein [Lysinibacillus halotolerans]
MEFLYGQESLKAIQWVLRAIIAFIFLFIAAKIMGHRSISQLGILDFAMAITVGNIIAHPLSDEGLGMGGSMITMSVLIILYIGCVYLSLKWMSFRHFIEPTPLPLIKNGQILSKNLTKARISIDYLLAELRKDKIEDIQKVAFAFWEADGTISSFLYPENQPLTQKDINIPQQQYTLPIVIIKEGKIDFNQLSNIAQNEEWIKNAILSTYKVDIQDVLLATIDQQNNLKVFLY